MALALVNDDDSGYLDGLEFVLKLKPDYRVCRGGRHHDFVNGKPIKGWINKDGTLHNETACARCGTVKIEDTTARGYYIKTPHYIWPEDYLARRSEHGTFAPADTSAALRAVQFYEQRGMDIPAAVRKPRAKKRAEKAG